MPVKSENELYAPGAGKRFFSSIFQRSSTKVLVSFVKRVLPEKRNYDLKFWFRLLRGSESVAEGLHSLVTRNRSLAFPKALEGELEYFEFCCALLVMSAI